MIGDGSNDAPALAAADASIAMGAAGSDVAIETADIALMSDDLGKLPEAMAISRATLANMRQNLAIALLTMAGLRRARQLRTSEGQDDRQEGTLEQFQEKWTHFSVGNCVKTNG